MKVLIVGGNSSLARALIPVISRFSEVVTAGRNDCDLEINLSNPTEIITFPDEFDVVINTAAHFGGSDVQAIQQCEVVNVLGLLKLCQACTRAQVKHLVQISSIFALLEPVSQFFSMYALSKKHADELAQLYSTTFTLPLTIVRPSQFYGVSSAMHKHQPFLMSMIDKADRGEDIHLYGSHDALRNFIHIDDVAQIISLVIQQRLIGTYNCQYPKDETYSSIATSAIQAFHSHSQIKFIPDQPDIPDNVLPIDDSLFRLIGYYPQISMSQGMNNEAARRK